MVELVDLVPAATSVAGRDETGAKGSLCEHELLKSVQKESPGYEDVPYLSA